jgi:hypothetical protein
MIKIIIESKRRHDVNTDKSFERVERLVHPIESVLWIQNRELFDQPHLQKALM